MMARRGLAVLLSALLAVPAVASPSKTSVAAIPIGTFSYSDSTNIGGSGAMAGTTVFSGDMIDVGPRGSAGILLNNGMPVRVSSASRLTLKELAGSAKQVEMEMFSGAARFRTSETSPVVARLADATARAKGAKPAVGIISILSPKKAMIGAEKGELLLNTAHDGKSITLHEGEFVELTLTSEQTSSQEDQKPRRRGILGYSLTGRQVVIIGALLVGAVTLIAFTGLDTGAGLTDQQKQNLVSPFKFP